MMKKRISLLIILSSFLLLAAAQNRYVNPAFFKIKRHSIITVELSPSVEKMREIELNYLPSEFTDPKLDWQQLNHNASGNSVIWTIELGKPTLIKFFKQKTLINESVDNRWLLEPGDSIHISIINNNLAFSGSGFEKFVFLYEISKIMAAIKMPDNSAIYSTKSVSDYIQWNAYINEKIDSLIFLLDKYKDKISSYSFDFIKEWMFNDVTYQIATKFMTLSGYMRKENVPLSEICTIYDSSYAKTIQRLFRRITGNYFYIGGTIHFKNQVYRKYGFDFSSNPLNSKFKRALLYYEIGKKFYKGIARENYSAWFLPNEVIDGNKVSPELDSLLNEYYAEPGYPQHKKIVKDFEAEKRTLIKGKSAPDFSLVTEKGNLFTKNDINGKIVLMDFWFTGCKGCVQLTPALRKVEEHFKGDTNVIFLSICTDKEISKWKRSVNEKIYTTGHGINLYAGGQTDSHSILSSYTVTSYPSLYLLDAEGKILEYPVPDPRNNNGLELINLIKSQLVLFQDGPYVFHYKDYIQACQISGDSVTINKLPSNGVCSLSAYTDDASFLFKIPLKKEMANEPSESAKPEKLYVLSDIEGNFGRFRKLLQSANVIDENYNWTFGTGHLVINGDVFDRGLQVTECLWLIYALEEQAKSVGGYVHYILGNHEIMNLNGNSKYVRIKYRINEKKLNTTHRYLYDNNSELGRWLRTKNIIEKIGDLLFVHGGISNKVNNLPLSISEMNNLARSYYDKDSLAINSGNQTLSILFDSKNNSPFWYRNYYLDKESKVVVGPKGIDTLYRASKLQIEETLAKFGVTHIFTGHTIFNHTKITSHFNDLVINTDTFHAGETSEGLLIEGNKYYRINETGKRVLLFEVPNDVTLK